MDKKIVVAGVIAVVLILVLLSAARHEKGGPSGAPPAPAGQAPHGGAAGEGNQSQVQAPANPQDQPAQQTNAQDQPVSTMSRLVCADTTGRMSTWRVYATPCSDNPSCGRLTQVPYDFREENCAPGPAACGNSLCEDGETKTNCKKDCDLLDLDFYHAENYEEMEYGGITRYYMLHIPPCYDGTPLPLMIGLHGSVGTGETFEESIGMNSKADEECFMAAYPNGVSAVGEPGKRQYWNSGPRNTDWYPIIEQVDDVGFISALIDKLSSEYAIDGKRIYATGLSGGGRMAYRLACELSDKIAAVAPIGALMHVECSPSRPLSVMHFHGTHDQYDPYYGGPVDFGNGYVEQNPSAAEVVGKWLVIDGCSDSAKVTYQRGEATCTTHDQCDAGTEVTFCVIENGGHTVPDGFSWPTEKLLGVGKITRDINAMDAMWGFLKGQSMP